jgi:hypothetical protein
VGSRDQEDNGSRQAWAKSLQDPISTNSGGTCLSSQLSGGTQIEELYSRPARAKITNATRGGAWLKWQMPSKHKALSSTPSTTKKKVKKNETTVSYFYYL